MSGEKAGTSEVRGSDRTLERLRAFAASVAAAMRRSRQAPGDDKLGLRDVSLPEVTQLSNSTLPTDALGQLRKALDPKNKDPF